MRFVILISSLLFLSIAVAQEKKLYRYDCVYRSPEELAELITKIIPGIKPVAQSGQLLFYTNSDKFIEIKKVIEKFDLKIESYLITFKIKSNSNSKETSFGVSGGLANKAKTIFIGDGSNALKINASDKDEIGSIESNQSVKVNPGAEAKIRLGSGDSNEYLHFKLTKMQKKSLEIDFDVGSSQGAIALKNNIRVIQNKWMFLGKFETEGSKSKQSITDSGNKRNTIHSEVFVLVKEIK